jgi:hypothetical protein
MLRIRTTTLTFALLAGALATPVVLLQGCGGGGGGGSGKGSTAAAITSETPGPLVEVTSPVSAELVAGASVAVVGSTGDLGHGVTRVAINGQEVATQAGAFQATVPLEPGVNTLVVEAWDQRGARTERHVSVLAGDRAPTGAPLPATAEVALRGAAAGLVSNFQTAGATGPVGMPPTRFIAAYSGNYTRRTGRVVRTVVIHTIEGSEAGCISWMQNPASRVSAHYVLSHAGRVTQMVREEDRAWHAGQINEQAIGIENEGYAGRNNWTDVQYRTLAQLVRSICDRHRIPLDRAHIIGHVEAPGATHTDPGRFFDWARFMTLVRGAGGTSARPRPSTQTITTGSGKALEVLWTPKAPVTANGVTRIELDVNVLTRAPLPGRLAESVVVRTPRRVLLSFAGAASNDVGVSVHQDVLNRALHAAWQAGALDLRLTAAELALIAPGTTATLDAAALVLRDPRLASVLSPGSALELSLSPELPPTTLVTSGGDVTLRVGALDVLVDVVDAAGVTTSLGTLRCALEVPAWIDGHGATSRLVAPTSELHVELPAASAVDLRRVADAAAPALRDALLGALSGIALPTPGGIDLRTQSLAATGETLTVSGTQR